MYVCSRVASSLLHGELCEVEPHCKGWIHVDGDISVVGNYNYMLECLY